MVIPHPRRLRGIRELECRKVGLGEALNYQEVPPPVPIVQLATA